MDDVGFRLILAFGDDEKAAVETGLSKIRLIRWCLFDDAGSFTN